MPAFDDIRHVLLTRTPAQMPDIRETEWRKLVQITAKGFVIFKRQRSK